VQVSDETRDGKPLRDIADIIDENGKGIKAYSDRDQVILETDALSTFGDRRELSWADAEALSQVLVREAGKARDWL
jgi:hypothetical protein